MISRLTQVMPEQSHPQVVDLVNRRKEVMAMLLKAGHRLHETDTEIARLIVQKETLERNNKRATLLKYIRNTFAEITHSIIFKQLEVFRFWTTVIQQVKTILIYPRALKSIEKKLASDLMQCYMTIKQQLEPLSPDNSEVDQKMADIEANLTILQNGLSRLACIEGGFPFPTELNAYELLGLSSRTSVDELNTRFKNLMKIIHPNSFLDSHTIGVDTKQSRLTQILIDAKTTILRENEHETNPSKGDLINRIHSRYPVLNNILSHMVVIFEAAYNKWPHAYSANSRSLTSLWVNQLDGEAFMSLFTMQYCHIDEDSMHNSFDDLRLCFKKAVGLSEECKRDLGLLGLILYEEITGTKLFDITNIEKFVVTTNVENGNHRITVTW